jgi:two-component system cell cycle sensor histidine kinase/response regulator CckA
MDVAFWRKWVYKDCTMRRTILVVDDEPHIRSLLKSILERERYRVLEAANGRQALGICDEYGEAIDLLLTDIVMPELDGIQLAERVSSKHPHMRVLYMSGKCEIEAVQRDIVEKGFGFVRKPFAIDSLVQKIREFLAGESGRKGPAHDEPPAAASSAGGRPA